MVETIIAAAITGSLAFLGTVYSTKKQHAITLEQVKTEIALLQKDISQLEAKQDKHNSVIERVYAVETTVSVLDERQKEIERRINGLEDDE